MLNSFIVLLPVFFVLALGYLAGRAKKFDSAQMSGLNELVIDYALPASLFVGTSSTSRDRLLQQGTLFLALLVAFLGLQAIVWLSSKFVFHRTTGTAAFQAYVSASPTSPLVGTPIISELFGASGLLSIAISAIIINLVQIPLTVILVEIELSQKTGKHSNLGQVFRASMLKAIEAPVIWAPVLAIVLVLIGVKVPDLADKMLSLIGAATSGIAIFFTGLTLSVHALKLNREVIINSILKSIVQPLLMVGLVILLHIPNPVAQEGIVICTIPSSVVGVVLASRYRLYESEASSTLLLTSMIMIVTLPIAIALIR
jgi:malonate transporter and related proteins